MLVSAVTIMQNLGLKRANLTRPAWSLGSFADILPRKIIK